MKKIAYIDHSFHQKTQSNDFLRDILRKEFVLKDFWDDSWKGGRAITADEINESNPDAVIYFQSIGKISEIKKIKSKNIIWIPMEDGYFKKKTEWLNYKKLGLKVLCFSEATFNRASKMGFDALHVQYFIKPKKQQSDFSKLKVYFWQRQSNINWNIVKKLLGNQKIDRLFFKNVPDPFSINLPIPSRQEIERYNIEISDKWMDRDEMDKILSDFNIFIAPRKYEGIGMAFLEAMAYGMAVVAPNTFTHNEYIKSGFNGYLYDLKNPRQIDFSDLKNVSNNAFETVRDGYAKWLESENKIIDFIDKKSKTAVLNNKEKASVILGNIFLAPIFKFEVFLKKIAKRMINKTLNHKQK
jgi:glycosyltransferase involved in cell wall biosynthesis